MIKKPSILEWKPYFGLGLDEICPYVWLGWLLITWARPFPSEFSISVMPD